MTVQSVMSGRKPHHNDLLLPGQQVIVIPLCPWHRECSDEGLLFAEANIVLMLFSSGTLLCNNVCLLIYCVLFVGCLSSQQHASVSQGRICTDNFTCCHTEIEAADQTFHLTQSQYTDTGPTSPSADPIMPGTWQGSHWSANF